MSRLRWFMVVVAVLGVALTIYLTIVHYAGLKPACTAGQSCIKVQTSPWSELAGVPVALIGLIGYVGILTALLLPDREETRLAVLGMTVIGFGFSVYLTYREGHSIHAYCEECLTSAGFLTVLMLCAISRYLLAPAAPADLPLLDPEHEFEPPGSEPAPVGPAGAGTRPMSGNRARRRSRAA